MASLNYGILECGHGRQLHVGFVEGIFMGVWGSYRSLGLGFRKSGWDGLCGAIGL
jgi:hypothetical protein